MSTETIEIFLWYIGVSVCFLIMVMFYNQYKKRSSQSRPFFLGLSIFGFSYGVARLIENIRRYSIGTYNDIFDNWVAGSQITGLNFWLRFLYYFIAWIGIAIMYWNIEKYIFTKNKYALTICSLIEGAISIINYFAFNFATYWLSVGVFFVVAFPIPILFLNLARKTPSGPVRNGCVFIAIGMTAFISGVMIDLPETSYLLYILGQEIPELVIRYTAPILLISGLLSFGFGFRSFFPKE